MKRSLIDKNIDWAIALCEKMHVALPSFAYWTPQDWEDKKDSTAYMRKVAMGWDVTDYLFGWFRLFKAHKLDGFSVEKSDI